MKIKGKKLTKSLTMFALVTLLMFGWLSFGSFNTYNSRNGASVSYSSSSGNWFSNLFSGRPYTSIRTTGDSVSVNYRTAGGQSGRVYFNDRTGSRAVYTNNGKGSRLSTSVRGRSSGNSFGNSDGFVRRF